MKENFVLEIAKGINEPEQKRIDKFFGLIEEANRLQKKLAKVLLEISSIKEEWYNGFNEEENKKDKPIFELTTPGNKTLLVYNPYLITPKGSILTDHEDDAILKNPEELKISAYARCPDYPGIPRKITRILCPKYERELNKNNIGNYEKCDTCIYRSGEFEIEGWNGEGYKAEEIKLRQFNIK